MIHENNLFSVDIPEKGAAKGHIVYKILSNSPEDMKLIGLSGSLAASILFEKLSAQGTNIIFSMDDASTKMDILARYENDGVDLLWNPQQIDPNRIKDVAEKIKDSLDEPIPEKRDVPKPKSKEPEELSEEEEEYLVKQITRIP